MFGLDTNLYVITGVQSDIKTGVWSENPSKPAQGGNCVMRDDVIFR